MMGLAEVEKTVDKSSLSPVNPYLCRPFTNHGCSDLWQIDFESRDATTTLIRKNREDYETDISTSQAPQKISPRLSQADANSQRPESALKPQKKRSQKTDRF